ncbi:phosphatase PAP2/dual specificity phosphatase family protein [Paraburkholderia silviterrae]|uniref:Phosphatase PAP2 family protein n=1 Tax=Paraburkholderia silviterrae TaxID=2528715 RepID=A0A4R5M4Q0_9BURK|nr:phosphatase PAP2/dual specificity phosphatase family protein [Paraburkholderia silviterrae]TDG20363.1 phosphatase PAP2 family protein [Paraburkholderia silviterrae]
MSESVGRSTNAAANVAGSERKATFAMQFGWLTLMGAVFFSTYGLANWLATQRAYVPSFSFGWERAIPFVPWSIVPYWSIDFLYALSFFFWTRRDDLLDHVKRLLTVQLISVACFILWPLRYDFARPATDGVAGTLITLLMGFDKPYNQAPSLHIALLVVLWAVYARHLRNRAARLAMHLWFAAIGVSVLTTWQHHVIDVPTGAAVGCLALFLFPLRNMASAPPDDDVASRTRRRALALRYTAAACVAGLAAIACIPRAVEWALVAGWGALGLACVAWVYCRGNAKAFQKDVLGHFPVPMLILFAPTIAGAFVNSRAWTWRRPAPVRIDERLSIGRTPTGGDLLRRGFTGLVDLTAEMPRWVSLDASCAYSAVPQLDLVAPSMQQLERALAALGCMHREGRDVLVCCALGYGRSVLCAAAWIARQRGLTDARAALAAVRERQPRAVCSDESISVLQDWIDRHCAMTEA